MKKKTIPKKNKMFSYDVPANEMDEKIMRESLLALSETIYWQAIKKYNRLRMSYTDSALRSVDPFKHPTEMARNQGINMGLMDLEIYIKGELEKREKATEEENRKNR